MMTKTLRELLAQAETWAREDQDELTEYAREIEARRTGILRCPTKNAPPWPRAWLRQTRASS
ncbi:MAG TPA: hypothetical protein VFQ87_11125 [Bradyrhizobium sp.]|jgi:hypothetical protein|nr:hypothetical protein [Bradyrhizobium sp.]